MRVFLTHHVGKRPQSGDGPLLPGVDCVSEVGQLDQPLGRHQNVLRLDVAVVDALTDKSGVDYTFSYIIEGMLACCQTCMEHIIHMEGTCTNQVF